MSAPAGSSPKLHERPSKRPGAGRRAGILVAAALSVSFAATCTWQIIAAVWFPPQPATDLSCRRGLLSLIDSVERARRLAAQESSGERAALANFRDAVEPEWRYLPTIRAKCTEDREALDALRTVELLRYAEERAVRYEALDLSRLRQQVPLLRRELSE